MVGFQVDYAKLRCEIQDRDEKLTAAVARAPGLSLSELASMASIWSMFTFHIAKKVDDL